MSELNKQLANNLRNLLTQRLGAATMEQVLSNRYEKLLSVMQEPNGNQFVSRVYDTGAEIDLSQPSMTFEESLKVMVGMYNSAGIDVVQHSVIPSELTDGHVTILSDYLSNAIPMGDAPFDAKKEAVEGLARLLDPSIKYLPTSEALISDLFLAKLGNDGALHPVIVDIDPRIERKSSLALIEDIQTATHFTMSQHIIEFGLASNPREAAKLAHTFLRSLPLDITDMGRGTKSLDSLLEMHSLSRGF